MIVLQEPAHSGTHNDSVILVLALPVWGLSMVDLQVVYLQKVDLGVIASWSESK